MARAAAPGGGVFIVAAARTPIGRLGGALAAVPAVELGAAAIRAAVERSGLPLDAPVDEVILGHVLGAGTGQAPGRRAALLAGLAERVPAYTVNRVCGSGLKAVTLAAAAIRAGDGDLLVAGGMESMSGAPHLLRWARAGRRLGDGTAEDALLRDGLWCAVEDCHMGTHAERTALEAGISREAQDAWAAESHRRAVAARAAGRTAAELVEVAAPDARGRHVAVTEDEGPRADATPEALARLAPVFAAPAEAGAAGEAARTVTAGNASGINDGAAALVVASERAVERHGLRPLARILGAAQAETAPRRLFHAPVAGIRALADRTGIAPGAFDRVELNEAFAAQVLADVGELGLDPGRVNPDGGAIALGHPIGASGARILVTLVHGLAHDGGRLGLAALCLGGGGSIALAVERT